MRMNITVLPGDGIGPEVTQEAVKLLRTVANIRGYRFEFSEAEIGGTAIQKAGSPLPRTTLDTCLSSDAVLLGAVGSPEFDHLPASQRPEAGLLTLRRALGGYANLRPAIAYAAIADASPLRPEIIKGADVLIVRELLGGLYFGQPRGFVGDNGSLAALNTMRYSTEEVERVAHVAFRAAMTRKRRVTSVDKANVLETSQLWRSTVSRVAEQYSDVELNHLYVDACAMHLMVEPRRFDVILTENLFGDVLSDEAAVITGSLGMLGSATIGGEVGLYEPVHGSAPDIAGRGVANPFGAIASAAMLLRYSGNLEQDAQDLEQAIVAVLESGYRTADIASESAHYIATTEEIGALVAEAFTEIVDRQHSYHAV
ncbi:MAG TPA: 3-isopropylmalate dehydrogenase [Pyrinomonadaceae bacterium]|nr:3-isopropylmalate dehydrogenase [Pyrinomonadaceae bacterium]